jgi:small subunit ribosomal protein S17
MAEDEKIENDEETPEPAAEEPAAAAEEPAAAAEAPPEADAIGEPEAAPAASPAEPETAPAAAPAEPAEVVAPKERRRRTRSAKAAKVRPRAPRTPEERHAERLAERRSKAQARRVRRQRERAKAATTTSAAQATAPRERGPGKQKTRQGVVVSDRADKTITVRIDISRRHPRYSKIVRTSSTLHAHDERNDAHAGDTVIVRESRPLSRTKRWRLVEVLERAK